MQAKEIISNISSIYKNYHIPANLQRHMKHVAAVAELMCENSKEKVDKDSIVASCLIHDLGNIVKMNFITNETIGLMDKEDQENIPLYLIKQKEVIEKYGKTDLEANISIGKELGVSEKVIRLIEHRALNIINGKFSSNNIEDMIASYSDMRVDPHGVVSLTERMEEYRKRYLIEGDIERMERSKIFMKLILVLEKELFLKMKITPEQVNSKTTEVYYKKY